MIIIYDSDNVCIGSRGWSWKKKEKTFFQEKRPARIQPARIQEQGEEKVPKGREEAYVKKKTLEAISL